MGKVDAGASRASNLKPSDTQQLTPQETNALGAFKGGFKVKRDTASRLILVSFASPDPQLAALVANTAVQSFIDQSFQSRHDAVMKSSEWLSRQLDDIRKKMDDSSEALTEFQRSIGVTDIDSNKSTYSEHMGELSRQQTMAQSERIQLQALLKNIDNPDSIPEVRTNTVVQQLSQKLAESRAALAQALVVYGSNHPTAKKMQSEVDELQSQLEIQKKAIVNSMRASYAAAQARESMMGAEMKGTSQELDKMAKYACAQEGSGGQCGAVQLLIWTNKGSWDLGGLEVGRYSDRRSGPGSGPADSPAPASEPERGSAGRSCRRLRAGFHL